MRKDVVIMVSVTAVIVGIVAFLIILQNPQKAVVISDPTKLVRDNRFGTGQANAKVTLVEFGDFQCPACGAAAPVIEEVLSAYKDNPNFNFVFRNFPLQQHANAMISAEAAEAAGAQGKFLDMYSLLYKNQTEWSDSTKPIDIFVKYAQQLNLDVNKFKQEVQSEKYKDIILADQQDGINIGINSTPTFYLNGQQSIGVPVAQGLKDLIDSELKK